MDRRGFLKTVGAGAIGIAFSGIGCRAQQTTAKNRQKPNIVFILIDDFGWMDLSCYGSTFYDTPNIDKLASQGMRFTDAYAASAVCSPTRAALMSGKYPARLHITDWIPGNRSKKKLDQLDFVQQLPLEEVTIAEALKQAGYATGFIGKWHLGKSDYYPDKQGFDVNIAGNHSGSPKGGYYSPHNMENLIDGPDDEYLPERLANEAMSFIEANKDKPFYLQLSHYTVHSPVQAKKELLAKYQARKENMQTPPGDKYVKEGADAWNREYQDHPAFATMVEAMDQNVERVMDKIKALGIEDNTIIIFASDNGGQSILFNKNAWGSNRPLRGGKGWHYEGGIRVATIVKWPGVTKPATTCNEPVISMDFYPTMLTMAGLKPIPTQHIDGLDLTALLKQKDTLDRKTLYWHYPHYHGSGHRPSGAIRHGDWKLIEFFENMRVELYNLKDDMGETKNLAKSMPDKAKQLTEMLHKWRNDVGADMPKPNPNWKG